MTNEEINEICDRAEIQYEQLKDRCHEQYDEIQELKSKISKIRELIKDNINATSDLLNEYLLNEEDNNKMITEILSEDLVYSNYLLETLGDEE